MKSRIACLGALVVAIVAFAFTTPKAERIVKTSADTFFYYEFIGSNDNAVTNINQWTAITANEYALPGCPGLQRACRIKADAALSSVPVSNQGSYQNPIVSGSVKEVKNRQSN